MNRNRPGPGQTGRRARRTAVRPPAATWAGAEADAKRRFQEALERKAVAGRSRQAREDGGLNLMDFIGPRGRNRTFRRNYG
ncbi:DUF5302 domain-containing protein [Streptomyces sp. M92]|uniref:DUF5302 domain-containing protein n=1 Tax=Streptomyces sp. M92 TaxID=2944250 RepID=UPI003FA69024